MHIIRIADTQYERVCDINHNSRIDGIKLNKDSLLCSTHLLFDKPFGLKSSSYLP